MKIKLSSEEAQLLLDLAHERRRALMTRAIKSIGVSQQLREDGSKEMALIDGLLPRLAGNER